MGIPIHILLSYLYFFSLQFLIAHTLYHGLINIHNLYLSLSLSLYYLHYFYVLVIFIFLLATLTLFFILPAIVSHTSTACVTY